ncbi:MAG TPA: hypothetical protein DIU15_20795, partial [Deltaproteobacteria bacterium]|nr:hypothetical protein [Deltaproteobacteria bacterium]
MSHKAQFGLTTVPPWLRAAPLWLALALVFPGCMCGGPCLGSDGELWLDCGGGMDMDDDDSDSHLPTDDDDIATDDDDTADD